MILKGLRQERFLYFFRASVRNVRQFSVEVQLRCFAVFRAMYMVICCSAIGRFGCFCSAFVGVAFVFLGSSHGFDGVEKGAFLYFFIGRQYATLGSFRWRCNFGVLLFLGLCIW